MSAIEWDVVKCLAHAAMNEAKAKLVKDCTFDPFGRVIFEDFTTETLRIPGFIMNDSEMKSIMFRVMAFEARRTNAPGLIIVSDTFSFKQTTAEQIARTKTDPAYREEITKYAQEHGIAAAAKAGYGELFEAITVNLSTRDQIYVLMQPYERHRHDGRIPASAAVKGDLPEHEIRFTEPVGELSSDSDEIEFVSGRMAPMYEGKRGE